jgi:hypothetical protein
MWKRVIMLGTSLSAAAVIVMTLVASRGSEDEAFLREFPDALIYRGVSLYHDGDYRGAAAAWKRYIAIAPAGSDTTAVREMIKETETKR